MTEISAYPMAARVAQIQRASNIRADVVVLDQVPDGVGPEDDDTVALKSARISGDDIALCACRPADSVMGGILDDDAVEIADSGCPGSIEADNVALDAIAGGIAVLNLKARVGVAGNDISGPGRRPAKQIVARTCSHPDTVVGVAERAAARRIHADVVTLNRVTG